MDNIFKTYFDALPCYLSVQDKDLRLIAVNTKFRNEFGNGEGKYCYEVYKNRTEKCEICPVEQTFKDGFSHSSEEIVKTLDGKSVWVLTNTAPIRDETGKIAAVMEMSIDMTEFKLLQNQLHESEKKLRFLFDEVPCFISIQDEDLNIRASNRMHREAFGSSRNSKCYEVYKHRKRECEPCIVRKTFEDGEIHTHEEVVTSRSNERMNVMVYTAPIKNEQGRIDRVIEMSVDITPIRQLQDKLSSVGILIGTISHGIKGLLNSLDGGIYLVNSGLKKNDRNRIDQGWDIATRNLNRIRTMVMDILYYVKDREPDREAVDPAGFIEELWASLKSRADKLDIEFTRSVDSNIGSLDADKHAVHSMLINLLENSFDACRLDTKREHHAVTIEARGQADNVVFEISDNGIGMDRETKEKALSLFFSSKGAGGTGLGLFIANKIAQSHGGGIEIQSLEGMGSKFTVTMPRKAPNEIPEPVERVPE